MQIEITSAIARGGKILKKGEKLNLKDVEAQNLIQRGRAKAVPTKTTKKATEEK